MKLKHHLYKRGGIPIFATISSACGPSTSAYTVWSFNFSLRQSKRNHPDTTCFSMWSFNFSLHQSKNVDIEAAWSKEIERRLVEIDAGEVELIPWNDVRLELFVESERRE